MRMKIGELAKRLELSPMTLRNYEKKGLIHPQRLPSGRRFYTEENIQEAIDLGLVLNKHAFDDIEGIRI